MTLLQFLLIQGNLVLLFGLYKLLAAKNGQYTFNRWYLLLSPLVAIVTPFLVFKQSATETIALLLPAVEILQETQQSNTAVINWSQIALGAGALIVLTLFGLSLWRLLSPRRAQFLEKYKGTSVYELKCENTTTHSLFNRIYLHPSHAEFRDIVLEHEYAHCKNRHSWDLILMALYKALFWFNPVIYKWGKEMQLNHEYLADAHVLSSGISARTYGATLLALNFSHSGGSLVHAFNQPSSLRKRIIHFKHQNKFNMKHLLLIPAVAALAFATTSMVASPASSKEKTRVETTIETSGHDETTEPEYPGGKEGLMNYFMTNLKYPEALEKSNVEGKVFIKFTIAASGLVENIQIARSSGYKDMDAEAIRVVNNMQKWTPGTKNGEKVATEMTIPIIFKL